jgi:hypothetical protein
MLLQNNAKTPSLLSPEAGASVNDVPALFSKLYYVFAFSSRPRERGRCKRGLPMLFKIAEYQCATTI